MKTLLSAIKELEKACLSKDSARTDASTFATVTEKECRDYYAWLRQQAPSTASFLPLFDDLAMPTFKS